MPVYIAALEVSTVPVTLVAVKFVNAEPDPEKLVAVNTPLLGL